MTSLQQQAAARLKPYAENFWGHLPMLPSPPVAVNAIPQIYILKINRSPAVQPGCPPLPSSPQSREADLR